MIEDSEIVRLLAKNVGSMQPSTATVALLMELFGRRFPDVEERLRSMDEFNSDMGDTMSVIDLRIVRMSGGRRTPQVSAEDKQKT